MKNLIFFEFEKKKLKFQVNTKICKIFFSSYIFFFLLKNFLVLFSNDLNSLILIVEILAGLVCQLDFLLSF